VAEPSLKVQAWAFFDQVVESAPFKALNPWELVDGKLTYVPDFETLALLLGVPLKLRATSQSGVPALALDVWTSYELRRAGFDSDRVWPRASAPRVLPYDVSVFVESLPIRLKRDVQARLERGQSGGTASASANLLGKNYVKQVDVVMSSWQTGPELLISTKRMDSSFACTIEVTAAGPPITAEASLSQVARCSVRDRGSCLASRVSRVACCARCNASTAVGGRP
jgi:hypothetical protein